MVSRRAEHGPEMGQAAPEGTRRNRGEYGVRVQDTAAVWEVSPPAESLMEAVVEGSNMRRAYDRVRRNRGAAGVDNMSVSELGPHLRKHWPRIKEDLLAGRYRPMAVLGIEIPKPSGGMRQLGIPTALDRLIQQALHQVLCPIFDPDFSDSSYGFRPGRSAHDALRAAREHVASGRRWVVDMDLEKFFDRVNHDVLMSRVARKVTDKRVLGLIRRYLQAGMMIDGMESQRFEGTPQGGPLSPLLSNILLDDLDKELEQRGHVFCRYADDCNIYVGSRRGGERVLASVARFLASKLKLKVNAEKSAVDRPWKRKFLGYSMTWHKRPKLKVAPASVKRFKQSMKREFRTGRGRNVGRFITETLRPKIQGWANYFKLAEVKGVFDELDQWLRRRLRAVIWRQWKRSYTRAKKLMQRGLGEEQAWRSATNGRGPWWNARSQHMHRAFRKKTFDAMGLPSLLDMRQTR